MDITRLKHEVTDGEAPWVGVAIRRNPSETSRHTGIIYRSVGGELHMADMAWHEIFRDEVYEAKHGYYCAVPEFPDDEVAKSFADYCAYVSASTQKKQPPYNLLVADPALFDTTGNWVSRDPDAGLNCSSFVVAIFHSYSNLRLVKVDTWPVGLPQDIQEQTDLVQKMLSSSRPQDRAQASKISQQIGKYPRVRPEETAGACLEDLHARPVVHAQGAEYGRRVLEEWDANHP